MLVLRKSTPVDQHPSLMETLNKKMPKQDKLSEMFLVAERLLNIKFMLYPYIRSMSSYVDANNSANFDNAEDPK